MKLTWFAGTTLRIHIGGSMLVVDAEGAPEDVDRTELVSGADTAFSLGDALMAADPKLWQPRRVAAPIDETAERPEVLVHRLGAASVLVDAVGEPPLVIATGEIGETGRWGRDAVVLVVGDDLAGIAEGVVDRVGPRLLVLAGTETEVETAIARVRDRLGGTGLMALEPAMALEV